MNNLRSATSTSLLLPLFATVQADNEHLEASLAAANSQVAKLQQELNSLNQLQQGLQASLEGKQSAEASLMTQLTQVGCWRACMDSTSRRAGQLCICAERLQTFDAPCQSSRATGTTVHDCFAALCLAGAC